MSEAREILCPNCGASLGASREGGEYGCAHCGHVSHQGKMRPVYGAEAEIQAYIQKESEAAMRDYARRAGNGPRSESPAETEAKSATSIVPVVVGVVVVMAAVVAAIALLLR